MFHLTDTPSYIQDGLDLENKTLGKFSINLNHLLDCRLFAIFRLLVEDDPSEKINNK